MKNDSAMALSADDPTRPTDWASPQPATVVGRFLANYWLARWERMTIPAVRSTRVLAAISSASTTSQVSHQSLIWSPSSRRHPKSSTTAPYSQPWSVRA